MRNSKLYIERLQLWKSMDKGRVLTLRKTARFLVMMKKEGPMYFVMSLDLY